RDSIGFALSRKNQRLEEIRTPNANTNVDVMPIDGLVLQRLRQSLGLWQRNLAARSGCSRSALSLIEHGHRRPSRALATRFIGVLREEAEARENHLVLREVDALSRMLQLFWTPVQRVEPAPGEKYVYDVAVADNETFLAGRG